MSMTPAQKKLVQRIIAVGHSVGATPMELKAAVETARVESNYSNPSGGDADSAGWRQERASLYPDPTNVEHSARRFFSEARKLRGKYGTAGALAAAVQRPAAQYRGRYQQVSGEADRVLGGLRAGANSASVGGPSAMGVGSVPDRRAALLAYAQNRKPGSGGSSLLDLKTQLDAAVTTTPTNSHTNPDLPEKGLSRLLELFYDPQGGWKNGQSIGPIGGHSDHVHVAAGPKTVKYLGEKALEMGLHVGENSNFNGGNKVSSGHASNSYHYKDEAIDVSGQKKKMDAYARWVRSTFALH